MEVTTSLFMFAADLFLLLMHSNAEIFRNKDFQNELTSHLIQLNNFSHGYLHHFKRIGGKDVAEMFAAANLAPVRPENPGPANIKNKPNLHDHSRFRRAAPTSKVPAGFSKISELTDKIHNEAVVHWSGNKSDVMFILTREHKPDGSVADSKLWRSQDYGSSFQPYNESAYFPGGTVIRYFYVSPSNKNKLLMTDVKNKKIFTTDDEGKTIKTNPVDFSPDHVTFHPRKDDWLMAYSYNDTTLYVSTDFAKTWKAVHNHVTGTRHFWAVKGLDKDESIIHMEINNPVKLTYSYMACAAPYCTDVTIDKTLGDIAVKSLVVQDQYIFVQKNTGMSSKLYVSYKRRPFKEAVFPPTLHPLDFSILNSDEGQVFLAVNHQERIVNLYLSDQSGIYYNQALDRLVNLRSTAGFMVDLYEVKGVSGVYIANQYVTEEKMKTFITFDKGAKWTLLPAPETDRNGKPTNCKLSNGCSLHLHLWYSSTSFSIPYILSEENAPGIIIAHGVTGNALRVGQTNVYISRNGGLTWSEVFQGSYRFNILDQGGAMVAVSENLHIPRNEIKYSCDEGMTWNTYNFSSKKVIVDGVLSEPGIMTLIVSIYGHANRNSGWTIVKLDFSKILTRKCNITSDYTTWTPAYQLKGHDCILGQKLTYERRKAKSECFNGVNYTRPISKSVCKCTEEDYECDFGFEKKGNNCTSASWFDPKLPPGECPEGSSYNKTNGYRRVAADKCSGGDIHPQVPTKCPLIPPGDLSITPAEKMVFKTNESVGFQLIQGKGSKKSTKYTWNFGDGHVEKGQKGFNGNHRYHRGGMFNVQVTATNKKGHTTANVSVIVADEILAVHVNVPHGVQINHTIDFNASIITSSSLSNKNAKNDFYPGNVHYVWQFADVPKSTKPLLTWDPNVKHIFTKPGRYTVVLEAINAVSSVFQKLDVMVYVKVITVRLSFSSTLDMITNDSPTWRKRFEYILMEKLMMTLSVERNRLEVVLLTGTPTLADVAILPSSDGADIDLEKLANDLVTAVKLEKVSVIVNGHSFVQVKHAYILPDVITPSTVGEKKRDYTAVYVCVPILLLAVFVSILVVMHYKKKFMDFRRYSLLQNRNAADSLLEEDDDDPPLDPNPDFNLRADDNDESLIGHEPTLVMMTGGDVALRDAQRPEIV